MRLIDANKLLKRMCAQCDIEVGDATCEPDECFVRTVIMDCPTIDAVPVVHGRWIDNVDENGMLCNAWRKCSACGGLNYSKKPPYCPNCGAQMEVK